MVMLESIEQYKLGLVAKEMLPHVSTATCTFLGTSFLYKEKEFAMFLAQCAHESMGGYYQREVWGPTKQQLRYEGTSLALTLGNKKGDGFRFRGTGLIQTTGRRNTRKASIAIFNDTRLIDHPHLLNVEQIGVQMSLFYWQSHKLGKYADDIRKCTKIINGGYNGLADRVRLWEKTKELLNVK